MDNNTKLQDCKECGFPTSTSPYKQITEEDLQLLSGYMEVEGVCESCLLVQLAELEVGIPIMASDIDSEEESKDQLDRIKEEFDEVYETLQEAIGYNRNNYTHEDLKSDVERLSKGMAVLQGFLNKMCSNLKG